MPNVWPFAILLIISSFIIGCSPNSRVREIGLVVDPLKAVGTPAPGGVSGWSTPGVMDMTPNATITPTAGQTLFYNDPTQTPDPSGTTVATATTTATALAATTTPTALASPSASATATATSGNFNATATPTASVTIFVATHTATPKATKTPVPTITASPCVPTATFTPTPICTGSPMAAGSVTPTPTPTSTGTHNGIGDCSMPVCSTCSKVETAKSNIHWSSIVGCGYACNTTHEMAIISMRSYEGGNNQCINNATDLKNCNIYISSSGFNDPINFPNPTNQNFKYQVRVEFETPNGIEVAWQQEYVYPGQASSGHAELIVEELPLTGMVKCTVKVGGAVKKTYQGCLTGNNCSATSNFKTKLCFEYSGGPTVNSSICL